MTLDHQQLAEMSCIACIGGNIKSLMRDANSFRERLVLDGCPLHCAKLSMERQGIEVENYLDLSTKGIKKKYHEYVSEEDFHRVWEADVIPVIQTISI